MSSENQRRHSEVQETLATSEAKPRQSAARRYWSRNSSSDLEREHAREEAAIETRLARMKSRTGFAVLQTQ